MGLGSWKPFNMKGFCYMYTLQVGIAIVAASGLTLTTTSVIVNIAEVVRAGKEDQNDSLGKSIVQYLIFLGFVTMGYVISIIALTAAYKEEVKPMKIALYILLIQFVLWIVLTLLSFLTVKTLGWTCVQSIRCADRFFIHNAHTRKSQENPGYSYTFRTDENPQKVFGYEQDCVSYCNAHKTENPPMGKSEAANTSNEVLRLYDSSTISTTLTNITTDTQESTVTSLNVTDHIDDRTPFTSKDPITNPPPDRKPKCKCRKEKKVISTLVGPEDSAVYFALSIAFTVFIGIVWYLYPICIFWSYINFLKAPPRGSNASSREPLAPKTSNASK